MTNISRGEEEEEHLPTHFPSVTLSLQTPPSPFFCHLSAMQRGVYKLYKLSPRVNIRANMIAQVECVTLGLALASSTEPAGADFFFFPCTTTGSSVLGFLTLSICWPAWVQKQGTGAEYTRINAARPSIKGFLHLRKSLFQFNSEPHAFMSDSLASNPVCCSLLMILISIYRTVNIGEACYKSSLFLCIQSWSICLQAFFLQL